MSSEELKIHEDRESSGELEQVPEEHKKIRGEYWENRQDILSQIKKDFPFENW